MTNERSLKLVSVPKPESTYFIVRSYNQFRRSVYESFIQSSAAQAFLQTSFLAWLIETSLIKSMIGGTSFEKKLKWLMNETATDDELKAATYSGNTLIAGLGLGLAYTAVHIITFGDFYLKAGSDIALGLLSGALIFYIPIAYWHAKITIKKNVLYEKSKKEKQEKINQLKAAILTLDPNLKEVGYDFQTRHADLAKFHNMQAFMEAFKKTSRIIMLFTIIFILEFSGFGELSPVMYAALGLGGVTGLLDWRAQRKENTHDLKLRELHEQTVALKEKYIALKQAQLKPSAATEKPKLDKELEDNLLKADVVAPRPNYEWTKYVFNKDNFLTATGVTSGYVAFACITLFAYHKHMVEEETYTPIALEAGTKSIEFLLFGIPFIVAMGIDLVNIYRNIWLHKFYADEEHRLKTRVETLKIQTRQMIDLYTINTLGLTAKINPYLKDDSLLSDEEKDRQEIATFYKNSEAFKKCLRVLTMSFLFLGSNLFSLGGGIGLVAIIAIGLAVLDYYVRQEKEQKETMIRNLKEKELRLLDVQQMLLDNAPNAEKAVQYTLPSTQTIPGGQIVPITSTDANPGSVIQQPLSTSPHGIPETNSSRSSSSTNVVGMDTSSSSGATITNSLNLSRQNSTDKKEEEKVIVQSTAQQVVFT